MIIKTLLDTDLYKFTMMQVMWKRYREREAKFRFKLRRNVDLLPVESKIKDAVLAVGDLRVSKKEADILSKVSGGAFTEEFRSYLTGGFSLKPEHVSVKRDERENGGLAIEVKGPWAETTLWEIVLLAIVSEVYYDHVDKSLGDKNISSFAEGRKRLDQKIDLALTCDDLRLLEFGTRRRRSREWQEYVARRLKERLPTQFIGTSNIWLAHMLGMEAQGTVAHEFQQGFQVISTRLEDCLKDALTVWLEVYKGRFGLALSDVLGMDFFLANFTKELAEAYVGCRHDSGDPYLWGEKLISHYRKLEIDPRTKVLGFSDGLDMSKAIDLTNYFKSECKSVAGAIGTLFTNDVGHERADMVVKLVELDGRPVAKISDSDGKTMCRDEGYLATLRQMVEKTLKEQR